MKCWFGLVLFACSVIISPALNKTASDIGLHGRAETSKTELDLGTSCVPEADVLGAVQKLSSAQDQSELDLAKKLLRANANSSPRCRKQVIAALMSAMDKPNLDLFRDELSFHLWLYGAELLGDLKAAEALDLLITHLDLNDGTSFSMNHHPAYLGVIKMGPIALPKLDAMLRHGPDRNMRRYAVFCIAQIGGPSALSVLKQALPLESDRCNSEFISASINAFDNRRLPNQITSENRSEWYSAFLCHDKQSVFRRTLHRHSSPMPSSLPRSC